MTRTIRAPRGTDISCKGWPQEAALRMLMNNLDPEVAERPGDLVVYGGTGRAARSWADFDAICRELRRLEADETLLVQSGRPVGVFRTHEEAPRVLIANANLVPKWATMEEFNRLEKLGLTMYGQMTAGSWIYIGTQGILQGTYETFMAAARTHWGPGRDLAGKFVLSGGLGGMGGAQPLAATMAGGVFLGVEIDPSRVDRRIEHRYLDERAESLDAALARIEECRAAGTARSIGLVGNAADVYAELVRRGITPDLVTDQTSAHDPVNGYIPQGLGLAQAAELRARDPEEHVRRARASMVVQVEAMLAMQTAGAHVFDYGNNLRGQAELGGLEGAFAYPGFVPAYIRGLFCEGKGPFRWAALSGDPADIAVTDRAVLEEVPDDPALATWIRMAGERVAWQGLPARICWLGYGQRERVGRRFNELVRTGKVSAPIVIGRDHLDTGSVASPNRETEAMKDGSDAIADWPILNALVNTAAGATWVSFHHGGGVGIGYSLHAGMVVVADGTERAARCLERVLTSDPGMGVIRHADAGYDEAIEFADQHGVVIPQAPRLMAAIDSVDLARRGAALEVSAGGATRLVRRVDLTPALGEPRPGEPRFAAARVAGGDVVVEYTGGGTECIAASALLADDLPTLIIDDIGVLLTCEGDPGEPLGITHDAAVVCGGGRILWLGPRAGLDQCGLRLEGTPRLHADGRMVSPGLIDCHAHPVFAGNRADEFGWRAAGKSYLEIGAAGGGIRATVEPTRAASFDQLLELTAGRIGRALAAGTTTCEAKSGYDLTVEGELRMLEVARVLDALHPVDLSPTLLGAHVLPPEFDDDRAGFVAAVADQMIPQAAERGLADAVDVYCDQNAFTLEETRRILEAGKRAGLSLRAHAGQFADLGAVRLLADLGGCSADHVENVSDDDIAAMAAHGIVAVMLPGACVQLRMAIPPIERFRAAGVPMAVATDMNPGTSMCETLPVQMWLAATHYGMTVEEAWLGVTRIAARVLGRHDLGVVAENARADLVLWNAESPAEIPYRYGANLVDTVVKDGRPL